MTSDELLLGLKGLEDEGRILGARIIGEHLVVYVDTDHEDYKDLEALMKTYGSI